jgi:multiple sugar transport system substrate-binding protein
MDEKVVFDNSQQDQQATVPSPSGGLPAQSGIDQTSVPPPVPPPPGGSEPPVPVSNSSASKKGIGNFLRSPLFRKIIIGIVIFVVLILLVVLLVPKRETVKNVKLAWWGLWEESRVMQGIIIDFKKIHPNIDIEYIKQTPKDYRDRLIARLKNGTGPDIFRFHNTWVPMLSDSLLPLSKDVITLEEFKKNYYPVMQADLVQNGGIYGVPLGVDTLGLFVNTEILQKSGVQVPGTWEDFNVAARKLTVRDKNGAIKIAGAALGTNSNITHWADIVSMFMVLQGVDMKKFTKFTDNELKALQFYLSFAPDSNGGDDNTWDASLDESKLAFSKGTLAMYLGYSWDVFDIQKLNPTLHFQVYPVPQLPGVKKTIASYWVEGVSSKSPNQKEALEFMSYLSKRETAQELYAEQAKVRAFGEPYARVDLAPSLKDNPLVYPFVSQLPYAYSSFFSTDTQDGEGGINSLANTQLKTALDALATGASSEDTVMKTLQEGVAKAFENYGVQQDSSQ